MSAEKITVQANVSAELKTVWEAYTRPEHITNWNFADPSWHCPRAENEMKVGGKYIARMEAKDGSYGFDFEAIYDEIVEGKSFTYTMPNGRQVSTFFASDGQLTKVETTFDPDQENSADLQKNGWQAILNNFKRYAEGL